MIVYLLVNTVNWKMYVGMTTFFLDKRWSEHVSCSNRHKDNGQLIVRAIRKYGKQSFQRYVLEECQSWDELKRAEKKWIRFLRTFYTYGTGYNMTKGGDGTLGRVTNDRTRKLLSVSHRRESLDPETLRRMSDTARKRYYVDHDGPNKGKVFGEDTRAKKRANVASARKPVFVYDTDGRCVLAYLSIDIAVEETGLGYRYLAGNRRKPKFVNGVTYRRSKRTIAELKLEADEKSKG